MVVGHVAAPPVGKTDTEAKEGQVGMVEVLAERGGRLAAVVTDEVARGGSKAAALEEVTTGRATAASVAAGLVAVEQLGPAVLKAAGTVAKRAGTAMMAAVVRVAVTAVGMVAVEMEVVMEAAVKEVATAVTVALEWAGQAGAGAREEVELVATAVVAMPVVAMVAAGT